MNRFKRWYSSYKKLDTIIWYGMYKGKTLKEVIDIDVQYIDWCLDVKIFRLSRSSKRYYLKKRKELNIKLRDLLIGMHEVEEKHGKWIDDGNGNCGFEREVDF